MKYYLLVLWMLYSYRVNYKSDFSQNSSLSKWGRRRHNSRSYIGTNCFGPDSRVVLVNNISLTNGTEIKIVKTLEFLGNILHNYSILTSQRRILWNNGHCSWRWPGIPYIVHWLIVHIILLWFLYWPYEVLMVGYTEKKHLVKRCNAFSSYG